MKRKRNSQENPVSEDKPSVWKKEISFRRKKADVVAAAEPAAPKSVAAKPEPAAEKSSIWKKEISFRRKKADAAPVAVEVQPEEARVAVPEVQEAPIEVVPVAEVERAPLEPAGAQTRSINESTLDDLIAQALAHLEQPQTPEPQTPELESEPEAARDEAPVVELVPEPLAEVIPFAPAEAPAPPAAEPIVVEIAPVEEVLVEAPPAAETVADVPLAAAPAPYQFEEPELEAPVYGDAELVSEEPVVEQIPVEDGVAPAEQAAAPAAEAKKSRKARKRGQSTLAEKPKKRFSLRKHKVKKIVGLKIGASQLAAAQISNNGHAALIQVAREPLEGGIVVGGELRAPEALAVALKAFFRKHKLPRRGVRLGVSNNRIGVRIFEIAGIENHEQLRNAVRFRAQETLPIPLDEAVLDYHVLGQSVDADGGPLHRILLVVAYRDLVERYALACRKAGIKLLGVDLEAFGLLRALGSDAVDPNDEERTGLVIVAIGHERSTFAVSDGGVCDFTRLVEWGGFSLNIAIARALDLSPSEAERLKRDLSLVEGAPLPDGLDEEQARKALIAVRRELESFARDLVSSLRFYQNQPGSLAIGEVVLTGGTSELEGLDAELERLIGVSVRVGDPLGRVKVGKRVKDREGLGSLTAAIGLGIEV